MQCFSFRAVRPQSLHTACAKGDVEAVQTALEAGAPVDAPDSRTGDTPLLAACWCGAADVTALLLAAGASAILANTYGQAPLHAACAHRSGAGSVALLLKHGADVNTITKGDRRTALHNACEYALPEAVMLLLSAGAQPAVLTRAGASPLSLAKARGDGTAGQLVLLLSPVTPAGLGDAAYRSVLHNGVVDERDGMVLGHLHC